jgi:hypothetical protein
VKVPNNENKIKDLRKIIQFVPQDHQPLPVQCNTLANNPKTVWHNRVLVTRLLKDSCFGTGTLFETANSPGSQTKIQAFHNVLQDYKNLL